MSAVVVVEEVGGWQVAGMSWAGKDDGELSLDDSAVSR